MRSIVFCLFLAIQSTALAQSGSAQKILDTEQRRFEAMTLKDTSLLDRLLDDRLVYIHSNALTEDKSAHISAISSGYLVYEKMMREQASVRRYGKTALTTGMVRVKGMLNQNPFELRLAYSAVYRKKRGTWKLVNWQSTRVP
jgi:hypothetical protein